MTLVYKQLTKENSLGLKKKWNSVTSPQEKIIRKPSYYYWLHKTQLISFLPDYRLSGHRWMIMNGVAGSYICNAKSQESWTWDCIHDDSYALQAERLPSGASNISIYTSGLSISACHQQKEWLLLNFHKLIKLYKKLTVRLTLWTSCQPLMTLPLL